MQLTSLTSAGTIARQPARLTANRLRRRERTNGAKRQGKAEGLSALYIPSEASLMYSLHGVAGNR